MPTRLEAGTWLCVLCTAFLLSTGLIAQGHACDGPYGLPNRFPLHVEPGQRYMQDAQGKPFLLVGDSAWSLIAQLSKEDADRYLQDRRKRGFNAILVNLLEHRFATNAPANIYGDKPFLVDADFSTPNDVYFQHADWILRRACELGLLVLLAPSYTGFGGREEGWYQEMIRNGPETLRQYGRFIGKRYQSFDNILWVHAGDYNPDDKNLVRAVANGIREFDEKALSTAHGSPEGSALGFWQKEPWLSVNTIYAGRDIYAEALRQLEDPSPLPFVLIESIYENEHGSDEAILRRQAYEALLSGASGQVFGNNPIWHFDGPGLYKTDQAWQEQLASPGAQSMTRLGGFFSSIEWWTLVPDTDGVILGKAPVQPAGIEQPAHISAARSRDGRLAVMYIPDGRSVTIQPDGLIGPDILAQWFDPAYGTYSPALGSPFPASQAQTLVPKPVNASGYRDWVLLLSSKGTDN